MNRDRFRSTWNGVATIIFFAGIFLGFRPLGYSSFGLAVFMWIIGGTVTNLIFGNPKNQSVSGASYERNQPKSQRRQSNCISCGTKLLPDSKFCPECGTAIKE